VSTPSTRTRIALVVALGGALAWLVFRGSSGGEPDRDTAATPEPRPAAATPAQRPAVAGPTRPEQAEATGAGTAATRMGEARDIYQQFAVYPPWSRPATPEYAELYAFNQHGIGDQQAIGATSKGELHARVALDRMFIEAGKPAVLTAECWIEKDGARQEVDFEAVAQVQVADVDPAAIDGDVEPIDLGYRTSDGELPLGRDAGQAARRTGRLDPADFPALAEAPRNARVMVWFQVDGADVDPKPLTLGFAYSTRPPLRVLGIAGDRIVDGSLEVTLEVDLAAVTPVRLRGALAQAGHTDRPIATYDQWYRPTAAGRQQVKLTFFGKILRDAELDGPYELFRVHGSAHVAGAPVPTVFFQEERTFRTRPYRAEQFRGDEWRDPEKDAKLRMYAKIIDDLQRR
jgi:hypothetical protein